MREIHWYYVVIMCYLCGMNLKKRQYFVFTSAAFLFVIAAVFTGCGVAAGRGSDSSDSADCDSIISKKEPMRELPDTMFASVEALNFRVDTLLGEVDGHISDFKDLYAGVDGSLTFRGGIRRDAPQVIVLDKTPDDIEVEWQYATGSHGTWGGGSGWTGQPVVISWPDSIYNRFKASDKVTSDFGRNEVIVGSLDGKVYFINADTGKASREAIAVGNPVKGAVSLDPTFNGLLYVGHGVPDTSPFGAVTIDLNSHSVIDIFGRDPKAQRGWGAYDSSPVRVGDFVFRPGENGTLYKWYVGDAGDKPKLHSTLRYTRSGSAPGIESSLAVYGNYGYFGDNAGNIMCVNLNTMKPVWMYDNHDDTDATPIVAEENGNVYVYTVSETDKQREGYGYFVKLDALTGNLIWEYKAASRRLDRDGKHFDGGFYATPLLGRGDCKSLIFANVVYNLKGSNGALIALDRQTGKEVWNTPLRTYAWSSPVAVMGPNDKMYIFDADTYGNAYLVNGTNGEILYREQIGSNFESSPSVIDNRLVVGSRGNLIFKLKIK